jgi:hypothetical protein
VELYLHSPISLYDMLNYIITRDTRSTGEDYTRRGQNMDAAKWK